MDELFYGIVWKLLFLGGIVGSLERRFEPASGRQLPVVAVTPKKVPVDQIPGMMTRDPDALLLSVQVYKTLSDAVVFDWYISLSDKDRMSSCDVAYMEDKNTNETSREVLLLSPFLPRQRTFMLSSLGASRSYRFHMMCADRSGRSYVTKPINFTTGPSGSPSSRDFLLGGRSDWAAGGGDAAALPALISSSSSSVASNSPKSTFPIFHTRGGGKEDVPGHRLRVKDKKVSPHLVLGISCAVVGFIIASITVALAARRYRQYRHSPSRLWELQTVQELELMPSFIDVPPRYSEDDVMRQLRVFPMYPAQNSYNNNNNINNNDEEEGSVGGGRCPCKSASPVRDNNDNDIIR